MIEIINETLHDSIFMLPILFITYLLIELYEHKISDNNMGLLKLQKFGPIFGALLGIVPQCGFSVIASMLFLEKKITMGTLISVFITTSDETIPILLSKPQLYSSIIVIIITKVILAIIIGYLVDLVLFKHKQVSRTISDDSEDHHSILFTALKHSLKIFAFILITNFILNGLMEMIGQSKLEGLLLTHQIFQPVLAAIFGFIPNCVVSVVLTQLYISGSVSFASLLAGSITNAGLGLVILIKYKIDSKTLFEICSILFVSALIVGIIMQIINPIFI